MPTEKTPSIMCETCGGWHPTEAHAQYEKEAREKRMAEIKARPDSSYRFDALGFTPEKKEEIEPWMHKMIEKAKELGDDLQDSEFYIHVGSREPGQTYEGEPVPSILSMITQESFQEPAWKGRFPGATEYLYVTHHQPGEEVQTWVTGGYVRADYEAIKNMLVLQEHYVQTRADEDLDQYKQTIKNLLQEKEKTTIGRYLKKEEVEELLSKLDTTEGRRAAVELIMRIPTGRRDLGIIFHYSDGLRQNFDYSSRKEGSGRGADSEIVDFFTLSDRGSADEEIITIRNFLETLKGERPELLADSMMSVHSVKNLDAAREFFRSFIHGIYLPQGSVEKQREALERMLEMTKDHPERRLPIYNFFGKLVWPRPPEEKKDQK